MDGLADNPAAAPATNADPSAPANPAAEAGSAVLDPVQPESATEAKWFENSDYYKSLSDAAEKTKAHSIFDKLKTADDALKSLVNAQKTIERGQHKKAPTAESSAEEIAAYRAFAGIPDTPEGYALPDDFALPDTDKGVYDALSKVAHTHNVPVAALHEITKAYYAAQNEAGEALANERSAKDRQALSVLRSEYGHDFPRVQNHISTLLNETMGEAGLKALSSATTPDGHLLLSDKSIFDGLAKLASQADPVGKYVPVNQGGQYTMTQSERYAALKEKARVGGAGWDGSPEQKEFYDLSRKFG